MEMMTKEFTFNSGKKKELVYVMIRGNNSGVFAGFLAKKKGQKVKLLQSRRIWKWEGAASISQIAITGPLKPEGCKFPQELPVHYVLDAIEIIPCSTDAHRRIAEVEVWEEPLQ